ncbi:MAG: hypothetical protein NWQ46_00515 [Spirosomaceae bacterium]|nr:hypothetical protein [Spirosomataceae bacterium]
MKRLLFAFCLFSFASYAQEPDDLLADLTEEMATESDIPLLPEKMLFTQRALWGENGAFRKIGIAPKVITAETRAKELKARRVYFRLHQGIGLATAAGMLLQGYLGTKIYNPETYTTKLDNWHSGNATFVNIAYASTALLSFTAPPPAIKRKKFDNIKLHSYLSVVHLSGMVTTNVLAERINRDFTVNKRLHRAAAFTTFGAYAAAIATIKLEF